MPPPSFPSPTRPTHIDATLDISPSVAAKPTGTAPGDTPKLCPRAGIVVEDTPRLSSDTQSLMRRRLRGAAVILAAGFDVFLIWRLVELGLGYESAQTLLGAHALVAAVLTLLAVWLWRRCPAAPVPLRVCEGIIFLLPAAYFLVFQYSALRQCAEDHRTMVNPAPPWMMLIFTYAMFIPNTTRRAALHVGGLAALPVALLFWMWAFDSICHEILHHDKAMLVELVLAMGLSSVAAIYGTHMIGNLRREAFEARQIGQYRLRRMLGAGGMGEVYLAEHELLKRPCAIKIIRPDNAADPRALARFEREVRATARLSHWNTVEVFDYGSTSDGTFYYVMEFLPGMSLSELVDRHGPLPPERAIHLLEQTCDALAEAHAKGLIHRDIKPGNIFAAERGGVHDVAKLLDFGLAKPLSAGVSSDLTQEGSITGSPSYMAPEQATGDHEPDERSDVYSLGAVAYFLLTGQPPFAYDNPIKVMLAHANETPAPISRLRPDTPADLERVILRCLAKRPEDRFTSAQALQAALIECEAAGGWTRTEASAWWRERDSLAATV